ncbi:unnamed protein product [Caenorhabditis bovis]|uniref:Glutaredoxin domain-containing protein n=1 Tax=Caenorhabditis bovis TaxID=2654633 RepID=A0A8S1ELC1_9PELO|nr:unnamed protein product [Caenorhabditis bovis]
MYIAKYTKMKRKVPLEELYYKMNSRKAIPPKVRELITDTLDDILHTNKQYLKIKHRLVEDLDFHDELYDDTEAFSMENIEDDQIGEIDDDEEENDECENTQNFQNMSFIDFGRMSRIEVYQKSLSKCDVVLKKEIRNCISLFYECGINLPGPESDEIRSDKSRQTKVLGTVFSIHMDNIKIKLNRNDKDVDHYYVYISPSKLGITEKELKNFKLGREITEYEMELIQIIEYILVEDRYKDIIEVVNELPSKYSHFEKNDIIRFLVNQKHLYDIDIMGGVKSKVNVEVIQNEVKTDPLVVYTKEHCEFCTRTKNLLADIKLPYKEINLDELKNKLPKEYLGIVNGLVYTTRQTSVPQIFVCGKFIGGHTELEALQRSGHLFEALAQCTGENAPREQ